MAVGISIKTTKLVYQVIFGILDGHTLSKQEDAIDHDKIATMVSKFKGFSGYTCYYRPFIFHYSVIAMSLSELLKRIDTSKVWTEACTHAFNTFK